MKLVYMTVIGLLVSSSVMASGWDYVSHGPATWAQLSPEYRLCSDGEQQSPIDLRDGVLAEVPTLNMHYLNSVGRVVDNGHAVQWTPSENMSVSYEGADYKLLQIHIHTPSEHLRDGRSFPAEAHMVHQGPSGKLLVVGVFLSQGTSSAFVDNMLRGLSRQMTTGLHPSALLPKNKAVFRYTGSLTTPPCTEGVTWLVMQNDVSMSPSQLTTLTDLHAGNARPPQVLHDRVVLLQR
jgi:carbonic anhydrase